jgi:hypothetical protein
MFLFLLTLTLYLIKKEVVWKRQESIDKNSLWGGMIIQKRQLYAKGVLAQDLGFVLGAFQRGFGGRGRGGEGAISTM